MRWGPPVHVSLGSAEMAVVVVAVVLIPMAVAIDVYKSGKKLAFRRPSRLIGFSTRSLTNLAVLLAGSGRPALRDEWHAHLGGESGHDPVTWRKVKEALGFVAAAVHYRLADAADLAWKPADAVLRSRALSNLFVSGPVIVTLFAIVHHDGRFGLEADDQDPGCTWRLPLRRDQDRPMVAPRQAAGAQGR